MRSCTCGTVVAYAVLAPAQRRESVNDCSFSTASARLNDDSRWRSCIEFSCCVSTNE